MTTLSDMANKAGPLFNVLIDVKRAQMLVRSVIEKADAVGIPLSARRDLGIVMIETEAASRKIVSRIQELEERERLGKNVIDLSSSARARAGLPRRSRPAVNPGGRPAVPAAPLDRGSRGAEGTREPEEAK